MIHFGIVQHSSGSGIGFSWCVRVSVCVSVGVPKKDTSSPKVQTTVICWNFLSQQMKDTGMGEIFV